MGERVTMEVYRPGTGVSRPYQCNDRQYGTIAEVHIRQDMLPRYLVHWEAVGGGIARKEASQSVVTSDCFDVYSVSRMVRVEM